MTFGQRAAIRIRLLVAMLVPTTSCAIHHYDERTGTEHVWGFGHMAVKIQKQGDAVEGTLRRLDALGVFVALDARESILGLGWVRRDRLETLQPDASIFVEGPASDFLDLRIGGQPLGSGAQAPENGEEIIR